MNWLSTQLSVSKTKVAPRKYSLFILKLHPIFTVPAANTCSPSNSLVKAVRRDLRHTNILDTECFGACVSRCVPRLSFLRHNVRPRSRSPGAGSYSVLHHIRPVSGKSKREVFFKSGVMTKSKLRVSRGNLVLRYMLSFS